MANELQFDFGTTGLPASGATSTYAIIRTAAGLYVYANGSTIEAYAAGHWTNYALALTESGTTGVYFGTFPVIAAGLYSLSFRQQAGVSPVPSPATDIRVGVQSLTWSGTAEVLGGAVTDKTGFSLAATGLDAIAVTDPGAPGSQTTLAKMLVGMWRWAFGKQTLTATQQKLYAADGSTVNATATVSDDLTTQTRGAFS